MWVSKFGRNFDQISTPQCRSLVEISTKLQHPKCRNFDQTSAPPMSKFGRSVLDLSMKYIVNLITCLSNCDTKLRPNFDQTSTKLRPHFDQTSTKLRRWGCRSFVEISTKLRPPSVEVWSNWWRSQQPEHNLLFLKISHLLHKIVH